MTALRLLGMQIARQNVRPTRGGNSEGQFPGPR